MKLFCFNYFIILETEKVHMYFALFCFNLYFKTFLFVGFIGFNFVYLKW